MHNIHTYSECRFKEVEKYSWEAEQLYAAVRKQMTVDSMCTNFEFVFK